MFEASKLVPSEKSVQLHLHNVQLLFHSTAKEEKCVGRRIRESKAHLNRMLKKRKREVDKQSDSDEEKKGYTELEMAISKAFIHLMTRLQMPQSL